MHVALVYPPTCDPTAPFLAVPMLAGFLRSHGVTVTPIDANLEAYDRLISQRGMEQTRARLVDRLAKLEAKPYLAHTDQLAYAALFRARADADALPSRVDEAKRTLQSEVTFFDRAAYAKATATIDAGLRVVSAAHTPLHVDFTAYRTPFGLLTPEDVARDASEELDPFHEYVAAELIPRLAAGKPDVVGLSVCFPGQLQPAFAFAAKIKRALPDVHLTAGGPGITQLLIRLQGDRLARALGPFDSAVVYEGEHTLLELVRAVSARSTKLREIGNVVVRDRLLGARYASKHGMEDLKALPSPDFTGLPLDRYWSPRLTLPYDPTRGCYWGKCTFCHYGLAEVGTAQYRERNVEVVVEHLAHLSAQHKTRHFYFSQDSVAPKTLLKLAEAIVASGLDIRWGTDLKPEKYLTRERAETLRKAGAVACALGVESAAPRVLSLIDKGAPIETVSTVVENLASAGVAPEAMCFTDFPTETTAEALATLDWLDARADALGTFILGEFGLTHGALVAQDPASFGIRETWSLEGDELGLGLFFELRDPPKTDAGRARIDKRLDQLSQRFDLRTYPWCGAVSTAHTLLYYDRFGRSALHARPTHARPFPPPDRAYEPRFDPRRLAETEARDAEIWARLVHEDRKVSRAAYEAYASETPKLPILRAQRGASSERERDRGARSGRRPLHAHNAATSKGKRRAR
ncbi:MAG: radical SAM protein [Polyangiaceae bacterium]